MRGRLLCLLPALSLGLWGVVRPAVCAVNNPPLKLAAPAIPEGQQLQSAPLTQGQPQGGITLHDIRGPVELPDASLIFLWLAIALAVLVIAGLLFYLLRRRKKSPQQPRSHDVALAELARLRQMMNGEQALIYAAQLSEILRRYVESRFQIHSTRQTTREFFADLTWHSQAVTASMEEHHDRLKECLEQCDMAKFAHCIPDQAEMEAMEEGVRSFIKATARTVDEQGEGKR